MRVFMILSRQQTDGEADATSRAGRIRRMSAGCSWGTHTNVRRSVLVRRQVLLGLRTHADRGVGDSALHVGVLLVVAADAHVALVGREVLRGPGTHADGGVGDRALHVGVLVVVAL